MIGEMSWGSGGVMGWGEGGIDNEII